MNLADLLLPTFTQMLRALGDWLDKGAAFERSAGRDADAVVALRLAPDMYPLAGQVLFCCFVSQDLVYRLRGEPLPEGVEELRRMGWASGEQPGTFEEAKSRIGSALELLSSVAPQSLDHRAAEEISLALPNGMIFDMTGEQYARDWALPQFYFHLMTAYGILRNRGVDLGKRDYVPYLFQYLRPGTRPQAA